jgi:hypothetical protein
MCVVVEISVAAGLLYDASAVMFARTAGADEVSAAGRTQRPAAESGIHVRLNGSSAGFDSVTGAVRVRTDSNTAGEEEAT